MLIKTDKHITDFNDPSLKGKNMLKASFEAGAFNSWKAIYLTHE